MNIARLQGQLLFSCDSYHEVYGFFHITVTEYQNSFRAPTPQFRQALDQIQWNPQTVQDLQRAALNGPQIILCNANGTVSTILSRASIHTHVSAHPPPILPVLWFGQFFV